MIFEMLKIPPGDSKGAALITIIVSMVVLGILGALMMSISSVGTFNPIGNNSSTRAFYLAESGYRYAAAKFAQGGETMLDNLNGQTWTIEPNQEFELEFRTYKMEGQSGNGTGSLTAEVPFGYVPEFPTDGTGGFVKIGNDPVTSFDDVNIADPHGTAVEFVKTGETWSNVSGRQVGLAAKSDGSPVPQGGDLQLENGTADEFFPGYNARFTADGRTYQYKSKDSAENKLMEITRVDGPWISPNLSSGDEIVLEDFVEVHSTGIFGEGIYGATREVVYHVPFSKGTGGRTFHDPFDDKANWIEEQNGTSAEGSHEIEEIQGDNALKVTDTSNLDPDDSYNYIESSLIEFDHSAAGMNLITHWSSNGNFLSYDAQVKIFVDDEPAYMDGISFRLDENGNSYGISLLKAYPNNEDGILDYFVPPPDQPYQPQPMVVLWQKDGTDFTDWKWIAYHNLDPGNYLTSTVFFEDDMESGDSKWIANGEWERISTSYHSPSHCWRDNPEGPNPPGSTRILESESFDLSNALSPRLSFWHGYTFRGGAEGKVEVTADGGQTWDELSQFNGRQWYWDEEEIDLSAYTGESDVKIRFRLTKNQGNSPQDQDWYIDDVVVDEEEEIIYWPTLLVSVREAAAVSFENGSTEIQDGDTVVGDSSGATGTAYGDPVLESGSWTNDDASGDILLRNVSGSFSANETLTVSGTNCATSTGFSVKENYIRAYTGDPDAHGSPDSNPLNRERLKNPRGTVNWPPYDPDDTAPSNDYYTLIQWNDSLDGSVTRLGTGNEENAVIRTNTLTSPEDNFPSSRPEIGLHTWGWGSSNGTPDEDEPPEIYFDDFGLRLQESGQINGFEPAIQE